MCVNACVSLGGADVNFLFQGVREALKEEVEKESAVLGRRALYRKSALIARLPSYLVVNFVRFFWRRDTNKKAKILRVCTRPRQGHNREGKTMHTAGACCRCSHTCHGPRAHARTHTHAHTHSRTHALLLYLGGALAAVGDWAQRVKFPVVLDMADVCTPELKAALEPARAQFRLFDDQQAEKRVRRCFAQLCMCVHVCIYV
jgi:hypothetical protein